jgi:hypothetical protein
MSDRLEFRIGQYLRGMEEILKGFRGAFAVKYWTNTAHEEHYNNSNGVKSSPCRLRHRPHCKDRKLDNYAFHAAT